MGVTAATEAALWTRSMGTCYAPDCTQPVVMDVEPGQPKKNVQMAHIYSDKEGGPRFDTKMLAERDHFAHLLLLCMPHHSLIDDDWRRFPPNVLYEWKRAREGADRDALAALGRVTEEKLTKLLLNAYEEPLKRLEGIADKLERTGSAGKELVQELRRTINVLGSVDRIDRSTVWMFADAVDSLPVAQLSSFAEMVDCLPVRDLSRFADAVEEFPHRQTDNLADAVSEVKRMRDLTEAMSDFSHAVDQLNRSDTTRELKSITDRLQHLSTVRPAAMPDQRHDEEPDFSGLKIAAGAVLAALIVGLLGGVGAMAWADGNEREHIDACTGPTPWKSPGRVAVEVRGTPIRSPAECATWYRPPIPSPTPRPK